MLLDIQYETPHIFESDPTQLNTMAIVGPTITMSYEEAISGKEVAI